MMSATHSTSWVKEVSRILPFIVCVAIWHILVSFNVVNSQLLPPPSAVLAAIGQMFVDNEITANLVVTLLTALGGLAVGIAFGVPIGTAMALNQTIDDFAEPLVRSTYSLPKTALVPLFLLWFGVGIVTNSLTVALACLLPVIIYTYHGIRDVPKILVWSALSIGLEPRKLLWRVYLPSAMHSILVGVRIALAFSFVLAISSEMIVANLGIGKLMFLYGENGAYDYMFAAALTIVFVAFIADQLMIAITIWQLRWMDPLQIGE